MRWKQVLLLVCATFVAAGGYYAWIWLKPAELAPGFAMSNGRIEAERVDVATKLAGRVEQVLVDEGDLVEAGQVLAHMDTAELDAQRRRAEASLKQAEQQFLQAKALLAQRISERVFAEKELERSSQLVANGYATQETVDQRHTALNTANAAVNAAKAGIDLADATILAARASIEQLDATIADAILKAPRGGRIQYRLALPGEVLAAGGKILTIADLTDIYMTIFLPARQAGRLAVGSEARIVLDPIPEYTIPATVTFVASTSQFTPKSVETAEERDKLMYRVKLTIPPALLAKYQKQAKAGVAGIGYVRIDPDAVWPVKLEPKLPQ